MLKPEWTSLLTERHFWITTMRSLLLRSHNSKKSSNWCKKKLKQLVRPILRELNSESNSTKSCRKTRCLNRKSTRKNLNSNRVLMMPIERWQCLRLRRRNSRPDSARSRAARRLNWPNRQPSRNPRRTKSMRGSWAIFAPSYRLSSQESRS